MTVITKRLLVIGLNSSNSPQTAQLGSSYAGTYTGSPEGLVPSVIYGLNSDGQVVALRLQADGSLVG